MYKITLLAFHRNKTKTQTKIEQISHHSLICRLYSCIVKLLLRRRDSHNKMSHVISNLSPLTHYSQAPRPLLGGPCDGVCL